MENAELLGQLIKAKRLSLNMSMDVLANKAGITRSTLWAIEKGTSNCSINTMFKILNILGISLSFGDDGIVYSDRSRATRHNLVKDKKINRFIVMCVEQYAASMNKDSGDIYPILLDSGVISDLEEDYEDLHGMSMTYLLDYISGILRRNNK